jgi:uncharacterized RDD family membrane protein YckC
MRGDEDVNVHGGGESSASTARARRAIAHTGGVYPHQVVTGEAVAVDLRLAGVGSRGIAALIDIVIVTIIQIAVLVVILAIGPGNNADAAVSILIVAVVGVTVGYPVGLETLWRGRTLGKAVMGLRVVRDDGGPIRFRHAFVRGLVGVFVDKPGITYGLAAFIPMMVGARHKRLGDLAAGTVVLQQRVPSRIDAPIAMPPALAGWAATLDLSAVDDGLALRVRQFLGRARQLTPTAQATLEHQLTTEITARIGPPPPNTPGWAVLAAVLAERRRRAFNQYSAAPQPPTPWSPTPPAAWSPAPGAATPTTPEAAPAPPDPTTGFVLPG